MPLVCDKKPGVESRSSDHSESAFYIFSEIKVIHQIGITKPTFDGLLEGCCKPSDPDYLGVQLSAASGDLPLEISC